MWGLTFALFAVIIGLWFRWRRKVFSVFRKLDIPGPEPNIIFGNAWEIYRKATVKCHEEWIAKYSKVVGYYLGGTPILLVTDIELMKKILISDFHKFQNRPVKLRSNPNPKKTDKFSQQLLSLRDKRWKELRSIITPSFTTSKMRMMFPLMDNAVDSLMNILDKKSENGESFDIYKLYQGLTMDVIGRTALGIKTDCQNNPDNLLLSASRTLFSGTFQSFLTILALSFPEFNGIWKRVQVFRLIFRNQGRNPITDLSDTVETVIKTRREQKTVVRQDLLQIMMDAGMAESDLSKVTDDQLIAQEEGTEQQKKSNLANNSAAKAPKQWRNMDNQEIVDNAILFFVAGFETTSTALAFTTHFLIHHQDIQQKTREEIKRVIKKEGKLDYSFIQHLQYLDQVFMESIRLYPPIYLFVNREASEDVQYGPYKIKKGLVIQIPVYNLHHDPDLWEDPEKFDPERFSPENKATRSSLAFQPFGAGPRNCVGMRFAQLEAKLALARILNKYQLLPTENTDKENIELRSTVVTLTPANGIYLKLVPVK